MDKEMKRRIPFFLSIILLGTIIGMLLTNKVQWFDAPIISLIQSLESPQLTMIMKIFTFIGSTKIVISIAILYILVAWLILKHRIEIIFFMITLLGSTLLNSLLKSLFHRERPTGYSIIQETGFSFPSGHSMAAFTLYVIIAFLIWKHLGNVFKRTAVIFLALVMILLIGISRIYLGVHYPSDVLGGYLVSSIWVYTCIYVYQWFLEIK